MADGYGSKANPVAQDPFQQIVEVHWSGTYLRLTFGMKVDSTPQGERGTGPGPSLVEPFSEAYVTEATPAYDPSQPEVSVWGGGGFVAVPPEDVSVSGIPGAPAAVSFDAWKVQGINVPASGLYAPFARFVAPSGGHPDIGLPGAETWFSTLSAQGEIVAQDYISAPMPLPIGGDVPLWATFNPALAQKNTFTLAMDGLSAVYKGRTYQAIAIKVTSQTEFSTGQLQVLLKRQALTA